VVTQPDDGGFVPFARRKRVSAVRARSNNKSNNDDAPITADIGGDRRGRGW
jgi:hypothetical protein